MAGSRQDRTERRWVVPAVVVVALAAVGVLAYLAATLADVGIDDDVTVTEGVVEALVPAPRSIALAQTRVGVDLAPGWDAELSIDGIPIPRDQLVQRDNDDALFEVFFDPGPGKVIDELGPGQVCAAADAFDILDPGTTRRIEWCFTVT